MVKIKDIPINERPIERLINNGASNLSNEELLTILFRTGTHSLSAYDLAFNLLKEVDNIVDIKDITLQQLLSIKGIGKSKAAIILATTELSRRLNSIIDTLVNKGSSPELIYEYYKNKLESKKQEHFYAVYLDNSKKIIKDKLLFIGTINYSLVHPREVFKEACKISASFIILVHNHPSGNVMPSSFDIKTTQNLIEIGNLMGINVLDHVIIGNNNYYSLLENKDIWKKSNMHILL